MSSHFVISSGVARKLLLKMYKRDFFNFLTTRNKMFCRKFSITLKPALVKRLYRSLVKNDFHLIKFANM